MALLRPFRSLLSRSRSQWFRRRQPRYLRLKRGCSRWAIWSTQGRGDSGDALERRHRCRCTASTEQRRQHLSNFERRPSPRRSCVPTLSHCRALRATAKLHKTLLYLLPPLTSSRAALAASGCLRLAGSRSAVVHVRSRLLRAAACLRATRRSSGRVCVRPTHGPWCSDATRRRPRTSNGSWQVSWKLLRRWACGTQRACSLTASCLGKRQTRSLE